MEEKENRNTPDETDFSASEESNRAMRETAATVRKTSAPWPWIAIALLAVAAFIFVLIRDNAAAAGGSPNEVVGRMDGAAFTKADVYDEMVKQLSVEQVAGALDNMMTLKMIDMEADKLGVTVTDADVDAELEKYKEQFGSEEALEAALSQSGMSLDDLKEQIGISVKLRKIFEPRINPTEEQLSQYFEDNKDIYGTPEQVRASHILLETKEEAEAVLAQLKDGADFAELAKQKSADPGSKENGGDLDYFGRGVMNEEFETAAFELSPGELSGVVESPDGFHIIKVTDKKEAVAPSYDEVKQQVRNDYLDAEIGESYTEWLEDKKREYQFENLLNEAEASASPSASAEN